MAHVECVPQEDPSPAEKRSHAIGWLRCERNGLSILATDTVHLVSVCVLQHQRIVVVLSLNIVCIGLVKITEILGEEITNAVEYVFLTVMG